MTARSVLLLAALSLSACSKQPASDSGSPAPRADRLNKALDRLDADTAAERKLETRLSSLEYRVSNLETGTAWVSTEEENFDIVRTRFGPFTVSSQGATPYLDGFKIKLTIGNLTTATFRGVKVNLAWAPPIDEAHPQESLRNLKHRDYDLPMVLRPGSFTTIELAVTPAKPEEIKNIGVGIELSELSLANRR